LDLAKGDYIIFFDDDDIAHPQNLELCVLELSNKDISFCRYIRAVFTGDFVYNFDYSKDYTFFQIDIKDIGNMLNNTLQFNSCAVMWKKECFEKNRFEENLMYAEEWELYARIVSSGFKGISINKCLFYGRKHVNSNTGEFYNDDPIRRASYANAILLAVINLKEKQLLSYSLIRYFIIMSLDFNEFNLFYQILKILELPAFEKLKWKFFYDTLPLRLSCYKMKKVIKKM
jgi:glycosyltransferase involved in cell wall biosynthesis